MARVIAICHSHAAPAPRARKAHAFWRKLMAAWFAPYRPERHYMRGPGPKWREKHPFAAPPLRNRHR
jgi:hypothetical protein